jgi:hypothetical protein
MSRTALLVFLLALLVVSGARAGVPVPPNCVTLLSGQGTPCQYRFRADAGMDTLVVWVLLRDAAGFPVTGCETRVTLTPNAGTAYFCSCCPNPQIVDTDALGEAEFFFARLGGHGELDVNVTAYSGATAYPISSNPIVFTSPDLDGSCDPLSSSTVQDLGLFAQCLPPSYCQYAAYGCGAVVNVVDLGVWAGGLGKGCQAPNPDCPY